MKKLFFAVVLTLCIALLSTSLGSNQSFAQEIKPCKPVVDAAAPEGDFAEESKVVVYLSERIESPPTNTTQPIKEIYDKYNCGEILYCLKEKVTAEIKKKPPNDKYTGNKGELWINQSMAKNYSICAVTGDDGIDLIAVYAGIIYRWMAGIVGSICILVIIVSGIQISIGGLSQEAVSTAKDRMFRSLVGLVVIFLSAFILYTINPIFFA